MRKFAALLVLLALPFALGVALRAATTAQIPDWAYAIPAPPPPPAPGVTPPPNPAATDTTLRTVQGSNKQVPRNRINQTDWFPEDHPVMPSIVASGRVGDPNATACSLCHYPNGKGRPENASVSGLPVSYFMQQLEDFRHDLRKSAGKEPIGVRIMETPENAEQTEVLRNPRMGTVAYVPVGSIKKGEALVTKGGNGKTIACGECHGADLLGMGPVPGIAGRSPSYLGRELYDMQAGTRNGEWTQLMKPVVAKLTSEDLVNIVAYVSSRPVNGTANATK
jgi:cytochrome c553